MAYEHKENNGTLFPNGRKRKETDPDYTGSINVNGVLFWLNGWHGQTKAGARRINVRVAEQNVQPQNAPHPAPVPLPPSPSKTLTGNVLTGSVQMSTNNLEDMEDDIPF